MRLYTTIALLATTLATTAASAHAGSPSTDSRARTSGTLRASVDSLRIATSIAEAERFAVAGRTGEARRRYRAVIEEQRANGDSPARTLWLMATSYYADGDEVSAARTLDAAAAAASEYGDPEAELRATFEAAVLYASNRMPEQVAPRLERVRRLLKSPAIAPEQRQSIERRIAKR